MNLLVALIGSLALANATPATAPTNASNESSLTERQDGATIFLVISFSVFLQGFNSSSGGLVPPRSSFYTFLRLKCLISHSSAPAAMTLVTAASALTPTRSSVPSTLPSSAPIAASSDTMPAFTWMVMDMFTSMSTLSSHGPSLLISETMVTLLLSGMQDNIAVSTDVVIFKVDSQTHFAR